ncbi:TetR/AcrR family transcriptional regulator [Tenggerimyces flavus]|uniref:HTH tetR-type domain-containing protein n=1 Tax=Tenggerimyces flavus TaxID=1708749 RepID=A0ABV7Y6N8_9ACTN|nr:TetR/AcrR family transcriptional regulator [Tenggerimyces flavus]MBM7788515.1 AcrR family transcriptional regulator [Tenggerimyces flavus]
MPSGATLSDEVSGWLAGVAETRWTGEASPAPASPAEPEPAPVVEERPATGVARRRRRLSDTETAARMLAAGAKLVGRTGLTVSLEHLSLEDLIHAAGVARSAVYRRWPYKDLFFGDLLRELAASLSLPVELDAAAPQWRTYLALRATVAGLPDDALRSELRKLLAEVDQEFFAQLPGGEAEGLVLLGRALTGP